MVNKPLTGQDLSYQLDGLPDRSSYLNAAATCLQSTISGDLLGYLEVDIPAQTGGVWLSEDDSFDLCLGAVSLLVEHPLVQLYQSGKAECVMRVSDCLPPRKFHTGTLRRPVFAPSLTTRQLSIITDSDTPPGRCWLIERSLHDFTDADLGHARGLQPMLALLDIIYSPQADKRHPVDDFRRHESQQRAGITDRELDIIELIAQGRSAQQIARLRRISVRTVRKHLENIYHKLNCHDRVLAINKARQLGLCQ
jgi:DNA-binding CsgD family transcriptional regulator